MPPNPLTLTRQSLYDLVWSKPIFDLAKRLRNKVEYTSLPAFLMPPEFTLTELQTIYEILLDRSIEKKSFRTRILASDLLEQVNRFKAGANRPAQLYRIRNPRHPVFFNRALIAPS
jgi:8-oxo-dGTP diphosphatase